MATAPRFYLASGLLAAALVSCKAPGAPGPLEAYRIGPDFTATVRATVPTDIWMPPGDGAPGERLPIVVGDAIKVVEIATGKTVAEDGLPRFSGPSAPRVSPDGRYLAYMTLVGMRQALVVWDMAQRRRVALPAFPTTETREVDLSAGARRLLLVTGGTLEQGLSVYDRESGQTLALEVPQALLKGVRAPAVSADGRFAAFAAATARGDLNVHVVDLRTGRPLAPPTLNTPDQETDPALSPDGRFLVFSSDRNGGFDLYAYDLDTARYMPAGVLNSFADEGAPRFLGPARLAYVSSRRGLPVWFAAAAPDWR